MAIGSYLTGFDGLPSALPLQHGVLPVLATEQPLVSVLSPLQGLAGADTLWPRCLFLFSSSHLALFALIMSSIG